MLRGKGFLNHSTVVRIPYSNSEKVNEAKPDTRSECFKLGESQTAK